jgi:hypothetical protein
MQSAEVGKPDTNASGNIMHPVAAEQTATSTATLLDSALKSPVHTGLVLHRSDFLSPSLPLAPITAAASSIVDGMLDDDHAPLQAALTTLPPPETVKRVEEVCSNSPESMQWARNCWKGSTAIPADNCGTWWQHGSTPSPSPFWSAGGAAGGAGGVPSGFPSGFPAGNSPATAAPPALRYDVDRGKAMLTSPLCAAGARYRAPYAITRPPMFYGRCYYCSYGSHSQKMCPLKYCTVCKQFGHSEAGCATLTPQLRRHGDVSALYSRVPPPLRSHDTVPGRIPAADDFRPFSR